jgi:hypothetical protein
VTRGTESKKVEDYFGAPKRLHKLEEHIKQIVKPWVELSEKAAGAEFERAIRRRP